MREELPVRSVLDASALLAYLQSLGDRAYLSTRLRLGWPVVTADRMWAALDVGVTVQLIRP